MDDYMRLLQPKGEMSDQRYLYHQPAAWTLDTSRKGHGMKIASRRVKLGK